MTTKDGQSSELQVSYRVRREDLFWMYPGARGVWLMLLPGVVFVLLSLAGWSPDPEPGHQAAGVFWGLVMLVGLPPLAIWVELVRLGRRHVAGKTVHLRIDETGVHGWPNLPDVDRSWSNLRQARRLGGVITLPFPEPGATRQGWVPIPERAFSPEQLASFRHLLATKGLLRHRAESRPSPPLST